MHRSNILPLKHYIFVTSIHHSQEISKHMSKRKLQLSIIGKPVQISVIVPFNFLRSLGKICRQQKKTDDTFLIFFQTMGLTFHAIVPLGQFCM